MSNNLDANIAEYWSRRMQVVRHKESVYMALGNTEERATLKNGDTVHRPSRSKPRTSLYTRNGTFTPKDISSTDETLVVNKTPLNSFDVDDLDVIQSNYSIMNEFSDDAGRFIEEYVDGDFLSEVVNADHVVDAGDVDGAAGTAATLTTSNVLKAFNAASKKLDRANIKMADRFAVVGPTPLQIIREYLGDRASTLGDTVAQNGFMGTFAGFQLYFSNSSYWTGTWTPANNPTNAATITIAGVTFTFVTTIGTTAGNVLIGASTADTLDNLVALINDPDTTSATQVALADDDAQTLEGCVATDGTTKLDIAFDGGGEVIVTTSEVADVWSLETSHLMFGKKGSVDIVVQAMPKTVFKDVPNSLATRVVNYTLYGIKTFNEGDASLVRVALSSSAW